MHGVTHGTQMHEKPLKARRGCTAQNRVITEQKQARCAKKDPRSAYNMFAQDADEHRVLQDQVLLWGPSLF